MSVKGLTDELLIDNVTDIGLVLMVEQFDHNKLLKIEFYLCSICLIYFLMQYL